MKSITSAIFDVIFILSFCGIWIGLGAVVMGAYGAVTTPLSDDQAFGYDDGVFRSGAVDIQIKDNYEWDYGGGIPDFIKRIDALELRVKKLEELLEGGNVTVPGDLRVDPDGTLHLWQEDSFRYNPPDQCRGLCGGQAFWNGTECLCPEEEK